MVVAGVEGANGLQSGSRKNLVLRFGVEEMFIILVW